MKGIRRFGYEHTIKKRPILILETSIQYYAFNRACLKIPRCEHTALKSKDYHLES